MLVVKLSWAEPGSRFTALLERMVIEWLEVASQQAVAEQMPLSWDGIIYRAMRSVLERRRRAIAPFRRRRDEHGQPSSPGMNLELGGV